jgi:hypothetical protein
MKNFKTIITLLIGAVIGFSVCQLFHRNGSDNATPFTITDNQGFGTGNESTGNRNSIPDKKIDSVQQRTQALNESLKKTKGALDKTKRKNIQLQTQVYDLIDRQGVYQRGA